MGISLDRNSYGQTEITEVAYNRLGDASKEHWIKQEQPPVYLLTVEGRKSLEDIENKRNKQIALEFEQRIRWANDEVKKVNQKMIDLTKSMDVVLKRDAAAAEFRAGVTMLLGSDSTDYTEILYMLKKKVESEKLFSGLFAIQVEKVAPELPELPVIK